MALDVDRAANAFRHLVAAAAELNQTRDGFRRAVERLAGCDLSEWSLSDLNKYAEGMMAKYRSKDETSTT